jgi:hypothetical protein
MKRIILNIFILGISTSLLNAQNDDDRTLIISKTNVEKLKELSGKFKDSFDLVLRDSTISTTIVYQNGDIGFLTGIDRNGKPIYSFDDNESAAISSKVNLVQSEGLSGFDLDGENVVIGVWESRLPLLTHQEIVGKVTYADNFSHGSHATHTATTLVGSGINPQAKGMATAASLLSHTSYQDEPEIIQFALAGGILSNHSYSSENPDGYIPFYGVYTPYSAEWDEILYYAPYLSIIKSASNSRNDGVNEEDGGYDLIFGSGGSKNTITVGAVDDVLEYTGPASVTQSEFSNWGPTDDWRIKPDITANGVELLSGDNDFDEDYIYKSGTSMSTPVVTGTVALLQQFYFDLNGTYMKAATVKSLLVCTTDELGDYDGPDFQSGWGLLNAARAAELVFNNGGISKISELSIANGESFSMEIEVDGNSSLELVIAWSDPAGIPLSSGGNDNSTPMLVNDLDIKISDSTNIYEPWVFTPNDTFNNFTDEPTKGDNFRDNIERIDISNLAPGKYTVTVSHKNSLFNGFQEFSLVINGLKDITSSINEKLTERNPILIYPMPSTDGIINIELLNNYNSDNYILHIFNINGKMLTDIVYTENKISLDISHLSPGIYFIRIQTDKEHFTQKIVIEK